MDEDVVDLLDIVVRLAEWLEPGEQALLGEVLTAGRGLIPVMGAEAAMASAAWDLDALCARGQVPGQGGGGW